MTTGDGSSRGEYGATADEPVVEPVVVDLDATEPDHEKLSAPTSRMSRFWALGLAAVLVAVLALGVFLGHVNARNAAAHTLRVFPGDLVVNIYSTDTERWHGSLTVINNGEQEVEVVGVDVPGIDLAMIARSVPVSPGDRATVNVTLSPECDSVPNNFASASTSGGTAENGTAQRPLALAVTTAEGQHTLNHSVALAPDRATRMIHIECVQSISPATASLEVNSVTDARPDESLPSRALLTIDNEGVAGEVIDVHSLVPGYAVTADALPAPAGDGTSTTVIDVTWSIDDCTRATSSAEFDTGVHIGATVRAEIDGERADRAIQGSIPPTVAQQLGMLAASNCPA